MMRNRESEEYAREDHKQNIIVALIVFLIWFCSVIGALMSITSWEWFAIVCIMAMISQLGFLQLMEWERKRHRQEDKEFNTLEKRLRFKSKVE